MGTNLKLVIGLGNPDQKYTGTRHNIGRDFITSTHSTIKLPPFRALGEAEYTSWPSDNALPSQEVLMVRSLTFMNETGPALKKILLKKNIKPEEILVIVDEFMIPFGTLRLGQKGSAGGHNGMKSIIEALGTSEFKRLRVGIGPVPAGEDPAEFVLKKFSSEERKSLPAVTDAIGKSIAIFASEGFEKAATTANKNHL